MVFGQNPVCRAFARRFFGSMLGFPSFCPTGYRVKDTVPHVLPDAFSGQCSVFLCFARRIIGSKILFPTFCPTDYRAKICLPLFCPIYRPSFSGLFRNTGNLPDRIIGQNSQIRKKARKLLGQTRVNQEKDPIPHHPSPSSSRKAPARPQNIDNSPH